MAIGFTPKYQEDYALHQLSHQQFIALAVEVATELGYEVEHVSDLGLVANHHKGMFTWNSKIRIVVENGFASIESSSLGNEFVDWGRNQKKVDAMVNQLDLQRQILTANDLTARYHEIKGQLLEADHDPLLLPAPTLKDKFFGFFSIFLPKESYVITPLLLNINLAIFLMMVIRGVGFFEPSGDSLVSWGANFKPATLEGQWWRLVSNFFLHIGVFHLLFNMYALVFIGVLLEPIIGKSRFLAAYFLSGIVASLTSLWWHDLTISAGASGAIFGMYGVFLALLTTNYIEKKSRVALLTSIGVFVIYNLLHGFKEGIDNAAHLGGLISGLLIGYAFLPSLDSQDSNIFKFGTITLLSFFILGGAIIAVGRMPSNYQEYNDKMNDFARAEATALKVLNLQTNAPKEVVLYGLREEGVNFWYEAIAILQSCDNLDLPDELKKRNKTLIRYCYLRIESYQLLYRGVWEETDKYSPQVEAYSREIQKIINELGGK